MKGGIYWDAHPSWLCVHLWNFFKSQMESRSLGTFVLNSGESVSGASRVNGGKLRSEVEGTVGMAKSRVSLVEKLSALLDAPAISSLSPVSVDIIPVWNSCAISNTGTNGSDTTSSELLSDIKARKEDKFIHLDGELAQMVEGARLACSSRIDARILQLYVPPMLGFIPMLQ